MKNHKVSYESLIKNNIKQIMCQDYPHKKLTCIINPVKQEVMFEVKATDADGRFTTLYDAIEFYNKN